jgi:hypothetical protein
LEHHLAEFLLRDMRPLQTVEGEGFKAFIYRLNPRFVIPNRAKITRQCDTLAKALQTKMRGIMKDVSYLAITVDGWTSTAIDSYLLVSGHWLDVDFQLNKCTLAVHPFYLSHTAENLRNEVSYVRVFCL